jgi:subtilase family serine protease
MKPYLKTHKGTSIYNNNTPINYAVACGWTGGQVKTNSCIHICSFGGTINGTHTKVGDKIYLVTNSDYHTYCNSIGVQPSLLYLYIDTPDAITTNPNEYIENVLDCSMCCMNQCKIVVSIFLNESSDFYYCFQKMLPGYLLTDGTLLKPTQISISWGCSEIYASTNDQTLLPDIVKNCGVAVFSASGDYCATNGTDELMVDHPSSVPYIIGVGGTTITSMNPFKEKVWNQNGYGTGGGYSKFFSKPSYQNCSGIKRAIPDICAVADPDTGARLCIYGMFSDGYGGTSMSAPFVCSMYAICQYNYGITTPLYSFLYKSNFFNDIIVGNNKDGELGYNATVGYDPCSGLGSIQWNKLINYFTPSPPALPPLRPTLFLNIRVNRRYNFIYPIQFNSRVLIIKNKIIIATKLGNYVISNSTMALNLTVRK